MYPELDDIDPVDPGEVLDPKVRDVVAATAKKYRRYGSNNQCRILSDALIDELSPIVKAEQLWFTARRDGQNVRAQDKHCLVLIGGCQRGDQRRVVGHSRRPDASPIRRSSPIGYCVRIDRRTGPALGDLFR